MGSGARTAPPYVRVGLRLATSADLAEVVAMERVCYSDPWPASAFSALPDNPRVFFAVARDAEAGRLEGYGIAWFVADEGELANLAVTPQSRRRGVASMLLERILEASSLRGTRDLYLEVRESNASARALYGRNQFMEVGRRKSYYRSPTEDALIMRRTLKP
jgi:ribosomal-protein-alanine N-acetyltransferase